MRRVCTLILAILCLAALAVPVLAVSSADQIRSDSVISAEGHCQVTTTVSIRLEENVSDLTFPLPGDATNITMNGSSARAKRSGQVKLVDISGITGGYAGTFTVTFQYRLPNVVSAEEDAVFVTVPLLSGFAYPVERMEFSVSLPGVVENRPSFSSGYFQDSIESSLDFVTQGNTVSGVMTAALKDRETLTMTLQVPEDMFPDSVTRKFDNTVGLVGMIACFCLAVLYYLAAMRPGFPFPHRRPNAPEGITAGELATYLHGGGTDLTLLVLSWAQMGYLMLQLDDNGRVLLHKRMEMGNERSAFENRYFRSLFGRRQMVDGSGYHYALLAQKLQKKAPAAQSVFRRSSGNPRIFRLLCIAAGFFGGTAMACVMVEGTALRTLLSILFGLLSAAGSYLLLHTASRLPLRDPMGSVLALGGCIILVLLGIISGQFVLSLLLILLQTLCGVGAAFGGRRTELGKQGISAIWGLRRYMTSASPAQLNQAMKYNPDYYYELAPYALALGVDKAFAKRFGTGKLPECPYLTAGMTGRMNAAEFAALLRHTVDALNTRLQKLPFEKLFGK